jgi:hypothetical protein
VDDETDTVRILGGAISVSGDGGHDRADSGRSEAIDPAQVQRIRIDSGNGRITVGPSKDDRLHWSCHGSRHGTDAPATAADGDALVLRLVDGRYSRCSIDVPGAIRVQIDGGNGRLTVVNPQGDLEASLANGKVVLQPDPAKAYSYDLSTVNGTIDRFDSSSVQGAVKIKISVANGRIVHERS